jgi:hypothetical protein
MKQKDLAEEYLTKSKEDAICFKNGEFPDIILYQKKDIKKAFNAGRESIVENIPNLLFKETREGLIADNGIFESIYHIYKAASVYKTRYAFATSYETPIQWYDTLEDAENAANEDYKKRIRQAFGL